MLKRCATTSGCHAATQIVLFGLLAFALSGCAKKNTARNYPPPPSPSRATGKNVPPGPVPTISDLYGYASWYGYPYHGRKTASGEVYDMNLLTAAHKTLPLGSVVRVTNQDNGREVEVRINDRGPFIEGRIIDLSYAAAKQIQMVGPGLALVKLSVLDTLNRMPPPAPAAQPQVVLASAVVPMPLAPMAAMPIARYGVQVGAFRQKDNATRLQEEISRRHSPVTIAQSGDLYRVLVGAEASEAGAQSLAASLRREHLTGKVVAIP
jgi:rare lipoprotein A